MSSPILWIILPLVVSVLLWFFEHNRIITAITSTVLCLLLAFLALILPFETQVDFGGLSFMLDSNLNVLGRYFILDDASRGILTFLYALGSFWFLGAYFTSVHRYFWPLGLTILSLTVGAIAVRPFFYSALILEVAVLLSIPFLYPPGVKIGQGGLRFLIFQSLAVPVILFAGWFAAGVEANPGNQALIFQAVIFTGLGVAFWLAVFPFYTWIPLILEETNLYAASVIISLFNSASLLTLLYLIDSFSWLRNFTYLPDILRLVGAIMVFLAGILALFERKLTRLLGYAFILETGVSLVTLSLLNQDGYQIYLTLLLPRLLSVGVWSIALSSLMSDGYLLIDDLKGLLYSRPITIITLIISFLTVGGLPLLATFSLRYIVYEELSQFSFLTVLWTFLGQALFLITAFRLIYRVSINRKEGWQFKDKRSIAILSTIGALLLILMGIFPNGLLAIMSALLNEFPLLRF